MNNHSAESKAGEPRIQPLQINELSDDLIAIIVRMIAVNRAVDSREQDVLTDLVPDSGVAAMPPADMSALLANLPEIVRTMLRHPDLFAKQVDIGIQLLVQGRLSPRIRELAILRMGWLCQAPYQWGEHVLVSRKLGITSDEIERITLGPEASGWNELEQAILKATDELYKDAMIGDATWAVLAKHLDDQQLIELPIVVGQYQTVAYYQNSLRLRLHDGNSGLKAR